MLFAPLQCRHTFFACCDPFESVPRCPPMQVESRRDMVPFDPWWFTIGDHSAPAVSCGVHFSLCHLALKIAVRTISSTRTMIVHLRRCGCFRLSQLRSVAIGAPPGLPPPPCPGGVATQVCPNERGESSLALLPVAFHVARRRVAGLCPGCLAG